MPRNDDAVKVINHADGAASKVAALVGAAIGVIAGAGAKSALDKRSNPEQPGSRSNTGGDSASPQDKNSKSGGGSTGPVSPFDRDAAGVKKESGVKGKLIRLGERKGWSWLGRAMQVQTRYGELQGNNLAAAVTLQAFLALFPMLLVAAAVIGWVVSGSDRDVPAEIINGMGLEGEAATSMREALQTAADSKRASSIIGFATLLWSALGVSAAIQYAYNQVWQTSGRGIKDKAVGAGWMAGAALLLVATAASATLVHWLPAGASIISIGIGIAITFALWLFTAKVLPNVDVHWKMLVPGAILGVVGLEILKYLGGVWVPKAVESSSALYGTIGIVLAVLAWLLLFGKLLVYSAVLNVVTYEGKYGVEQAEIQMPGPAASKNKGGDVARSGRAD